MKGTHIVVSFGVLEYIQGISDVMVFYIKRLGSDAGDTFALDLPILSIDMHYEKDTLGSQGLYSK